MDTDPARFAHVADFGVDEHIWHHVCTKPINDGGRGPKELTGMVNLTRDQHGRVRVRLLDLVPRRSGKAYADWLEQRGPEFRGGVKVAALDLFQGYKTSIDYKLQDSVAVLDAFHIVELATAAVDECRRRAQQETLGHRDRRGDPLYGIQNMLRAGQEALTDKQWDRFCRRRDRSRRSPPAKVVGVVVRPTAPFGLSSPQPRASTQDRRARSGDVHELPGARNHQTRPDPQTMEHYSEPSTVCCHLRQTPQCANR